MVNSTFDSPRQNKANWRESFKCEVSSVKSGRPGWQPSASSRFRLYTLHFKLGRRPFVQNKPNSAVPVGRGLRARAVRCCTNKPNFGPGKMKGKCCANKELRRVCCESGPAKTKPIRPGGGYRGSGFSGPRPGARTLDRSYKQTQLREV
jgi:hypothetical protein